MLSPSPTPIAVPYISTLGAARRQERALRNAYEGLPLGHPERKRLKQYLEYARRTTAAMMRRRVSR